MRKLYAIATCLLASSAAAAAFSVSAKGQDTYDVAPGTATKAIALLAAVERCKASDVLQPPSEPFTSLAVDACISRYWHQYAWQIMEDFQNPNETRSGVWIDRDGVTASGNWIIDNLKVSEDEKGRIIYHLDTMHDTTEKETGE